jgi:hypothetical protein
MSQNLQLINSDFMRERERGREREREREPESLLDHGFDHVCSLSYTLSF